MQSLARRWQRRGLSIGFVPTMGALHEGHASLIRRARRETDRIVVSIFVNPLQFGPKEDFRRYPRTLDEDRVLCRREGVHAIYLPDAAAMYPKEFKTSVEVRGLSELLCGKFRPGHFKGVATVVLKLLEAVRPDKAYFGEKDFQQLAILRRMAEDLNLPARVVGCPTAREKDGLAMSSRNRHLSPAERSQASLLHASLAGAAGRARAPEELVARARRGILRIPKVKIDYVALVDGQTLEPAKSLRGSLRLLAAIRMGKTRLIDNVPIRP